MAKTKKAKNDKSPEIALTRTLGTDRAEVKSERFRAVRNDCVVEFQECGGHDDNSIDMICTSIPFGNQYEYSPSYNDFGHCSDHTVFFEQMDFLTPNLLRVLKPGRVAAIHVKDRIRFGAVTGFGMPTVDRFSDKTADCFEKAGFKFAARITIDTDVVRENNQTYRLGWSENAKDSSKMGAGMPEYVLVFRKLPTDTSDAYADTPVTKSKVQVTEYSCPKCSQKEDSSTAFVDASTPVEAWRCPKCKQLLKDGPNAEIVTPAYTRSDWQIDAAGFWRSSGNRLPDPDYLAGLDMQAVGAWWRNYCLQGGYDFKEHVELAKSLEVKGRLPSSFMLFPPISRNKDIWTDIARMRTLNMEQQRRGAEKHVCPLQLDIIERLITRYTNVNDIVMDPFAGIFSVPYMAVKMERQGIGIELNEEYWRNGVGYCQMAEQKATAPTLLDISSL